MRNVCAIFMKQVNDTLKNKTVLIQFVMFPIMAVVMENLIQPDAVPDGFFVKLFSVMFVGMAPLTCMASILAEEKEKNTLRVLIMSNVSPLQYLIGIGSYVFAACVLGTAVFAITGKYQGKELASYLLIMAAGILLSEIIGAGIGIWGQSQMAATSLTVPVMMLFSFVPMLSNFNESVRKFGSVLYSQQMNEMISGIGKTLPGGKSLAIFAANFLAAVLFFGFAFKKRGLE